MKTSVHHWEPGAENSQLVAEAIRFLQQGEPIALPTETVYGLAADALNPKAVARIFAVKNRPRFNPLIVHLPDREWLERVTRIPKNDEALIQKLVERFWPGPLTCVLPRQTIVPDIVTAGLETVAVRMSSHPAFAAISIAFKRPLSAPSANRFGHVSPTTAEHVLEELEGIIPLVIDGGPSTYGLESTIVSVQNGQIDILRSGPITKEELDSYGKTKIVEVGARVIAPGQLPAHYAPRTPLCLVDDATKFSAGPNERIGLLAWEYPDTNGKYAAVRHLSKRRDLPEAATNLFRYLRELDALNLDLIVAELVPEEGLGLAIMDRLRRAAHK